MLGGRVVEIVAPVRLLLAASMVLRWHSEKEESTIRGTLLPSERLAVSIISLVAWLCMGCGFDSCD